MDNPVERTRRSSSVRVDSTFVAGRDGEDSPPSTNSEVVSYCLFEVHSRLLQDSRRSEVIGMTRRRYPAQSQLVEPEDDESTGYFGGVAMSPRFPRQDVAQFTCRRFPGDGEVGDADQLIVESRDGEGE